MIVSAVASDRPGVNAVTTPDMAALTLEVAIDNDVVLIDDQTPLSHILSGLDEDIMVHLDVRRGTDIETLNKAMMRELDRRDRAMMVSIDNDAIMPDGVNRPVPYGLRVASRGAMLIEPRLRASEANFVVTNMGHYDIAKMCATNLNIPLVVTSNGQASEENKVFSDPYETFMMVSKDFAGALTRWRWLNSQND